jgi:hypothetical protein
MAETHFFFSYFSFGLHLLGRNSLSQPAVCAWVQVRQEEEEREGKEKRQVAVRGTKGKRGEEKERKK